MLTEEIELQRRFLLPLTLTGSGSNGILHVVVDFCWSWISACIMVVVQVAMVFVEVLTVVSSHQSTHPCVYSVVFGEEHRVMWPTEPGKQRNAFFSHLLRSLFFSSFSLGSCFSSSDRTSRRCGAYTLWMDSNMIVPPYTEQMVQFKVLHRNTRCT